jgi:uridylate kinase
LIQAPKTDLKKRYPRILLKLSGEALMGDQAHGLDSSALQKIAIEIKDVHQEGVEICIVIGGGNFFRGVSNGTTQGIDRATADYMGMMATVINALALQSALESVGLPTRVQSAIPMDAVCERYVRRRAIEHLEQGRIVIFAAGSGNPFFTTDTAAVLRASEMNCSILLKGTKVDGVYSADPLKDENAVHYKTLDYLDALAQNLRVMDMAAIALARENEMPILVFSILSSTGLMDALCGKGRFTLVSA